MPDALSYLRGGQPQPPQSSSNIVNQLTSYKPPVGQSIGAPRTTGYSTGQGFAKLPGSEGVAGEAPGMSTGAPASDVGAPQNLLGGSSPSQTVQEFKAPGGETFASYSAGRLLFYEGGKPSGNVELRGQAPGYSEALAAYRAAGVGQQRTEYFGARGESLGRYSGSGPGYRSAYFQAYGLPSQQIGDTSPIDVSKLEGRRAEDIHFWGGAGAKGEAATPKYLLGAKLIQESGVGANRVYYFLNAAGNRVFATDVYGRGRGAFSTSLLTRAPSEAQVETPSEGTAYSRLSEAQRLQAFGVGRAPVLLDRLGLRYAAENKEVVVKPVMAAAPKFGFGLSQRILEVGPKVTPNVPLLKEFVIGGASTFGGIADVLKEATPRELGGAGRLPETALSVGAGVVAFPFIAAEEVRTEGLGGAARVAGQLVAGASIGSVLGRAGKAVGKQLAMERVAVGKTTLQFKEFALKNLPAEQAVPGVLSESGFVPGKPALPPGIMGSFVGQAETKVVGLFGPKTVKSVASVVSQTRMVGEKALFAGRGVIESGKQTFPVELRGFGKELLPGASKIEAVGGGKFEVVSPVYPSGFGAVSKVSVGGGALKTVFSYAGKTIDQVRFLAGREVKASGFDIYTLSGKRVSFGALELYDIRGFGGEKPVAFVQAPGAGGQVTFSKIASQPITPALAELVSKQSAKVGQTLGGFKTQAGRVGGAVGYKVGTATGGLLGIGASATISKTIPKERVVSFASSSYRLPQERTASSVYFKPSSSVLAPIALFKLSFASTPGQGYSPRTISIQAPRLAEELLPLRSQPSLQGQPQLREVLQLQRQVSLQMPRQVTAPVSPKLSIAPPLPFGKPSQKFGVKLFKRSEKKGKVRAASVVAPLATYSEKALTELRTGRPAKSPGVLRSQREFVRSFGARVPTAEMLRGRFK